VNAQIRNTQTSKLFFGVPNAHVYKQTCAHCSVLFEGLIAGLKLAGLNPAKCPAKSPAKRLPRNKNCLAKVQTRIAKFLLARFGDFCIAILSEQGETCKSEFGLFWGNFFAGLFAGHFAGLSPASFSPVRCSAKGTKLGNLAVAYTL